MKTSSSTIRTNNNGENDIRTNLTKCSLIEGFHLLFHESGVASLFHPLSASFGQKKIYSAPHTLRGRVNFVISFVEIFALICTQTA